MSDLLDASSIIHAWDEYPIKTFPPLWDWLSQEIKGGQIRMPDIIFDEVKRSRPDCHSWLKGQGVHTFSANNNMTNKARSIESELDIQNGNYHAKGVSQNDILLVAAAYYTKEKLITDEKPQSDKPKNDKRRYKIPAVCTMPSVKVNYCKFRDYLIDSGVVFN